MPHMTIIVSHAGATLYTTEHSSYPFRVECLLVFSSWVPWNHFFLDWLFCGVLFLFLWWFMMSLVDEDIQKLQSFRNPETI